MRPLCRATTFPIGVQHHAPDTPPAVIHKFRFHPQICSALWFFRTLFDAPMGSWTQRITGPRSAHGTNASPRWHYWIEQPSWLVLHDTASDTVCATATMATSDAGDREALARTSSKIQDDDACIPLSRSTLSGRFRRRLEEPAKSCPTSTIDQSRRPKVGPLERRAPRLVSETPDCEARRLAKHADDGRLACTISGFDFRQHTARMVTAICDMPSRRAASRPLAKRRPGSTT